MTRGHHLHTPRLFGALVAALGTTVALLSAPSAASAQSTQSAQSTPAAHASAQVSAQVSALAPVLNLTPPRVTGSPVFGSPVVASPGSWQPGDATYSYRWLRGGKPIAGATGRRYRPALKDIGRNLAVRVTASHPDRTSTSVRSAAVQVRRARLLPRSKPVVTGSRRFAHTLRADKGRWTLKPKRVRFQWQRNGRPIKGAKGPRYRVRASDVGKKVRVRVTATRPGYLKHSNASVPKKALHRVALRRTVRYSVETRGRISASVRTFRRLAKQTLNDPRGWRGSGIGFKEVRSSNAMRLVLAEASTVPSFSSGCSSRWSCRVGRYVIINQTRWQHASPAWKQYGGSLRGYRHMVVNHETGHWLGWDHRSCPRAGAVAPLMQQQSISLQGCRFNPWPTASERNVPRF